MKNALLLALIPQGIEWITQIVNAIGSDPGNPAEQQAKLDKLSASLQQCILDVQAVQLPDKQ